MSDVVARVLEALNGHDIEAFVECYTEDATIENGHDEVGARGHDELRARYGPMFEKFPDVHVTALQRIDAGDFVVQHEEVTGRGDPARHVAVYLVRDGRIARERLIA
ncbi:MAG TPA: nuclear transport factor 2 family protein [Gaiellaceae bacterium]|nr:nuclear transport factor 2 family protein [Gaiellaceae bacterium]